MSEGSERHVEGVTDRSGIDTAKLGVLLARAVGGGLGDEVTEDFARERHERDAGVGRDRRDGADGDPHAPEGTGLGADDGRGLGLHHEAAQRECESGIVVGETTEASDLPGVEGGIRDAIALDMEREHARITARRSGFEHRFCRERTSRPSCGGRSP